MRVVIASDEGAAEAASELQAALEAAGLSVAIAMPEAAGAGRLGALAEALRAGEAALDGADGAAVLGRGEAPFGAALAATKLDVAVFWVDAAEGEPANAGLIGLIADHELPVDPAAAAGEIVRILGATPASGPGG